MPGVKASLVSKDPAGQNNRVMFQGDEVAAVAADTEEHAIDAARRIKIEYDIQPHMTSEEKALAGTAPPVFTGGNVRAGLGSICQPVADGGVCEDRRRRLRFVGSGEVCGGSPPATLNGPG